MSFRLPSTRRERPYIRVYPDAVRLALRMKSLVDHKVLMSILWYTESDAAMVELSATRRNWICGNIGIDAPSLSRSLRSLMSLHVIKQLDRMTYLVNPNMFWRGSSKGRHEFLGRNQDMPYFSPPII